MTKTIGARRSLRWRLMILSSGELSLASHMLTGGRKARAGQDVRLLDIPADAGAGFGMFRERHGVASVRSTAHCLLFDNAKKKRNHWWANSAFLTFRFRTLAGSRSLSAEEERRAFT